MYLIKEAELWCGVFNKKINIQTKLGAAVGNENMIDE
jgi:hypothetical protein